MCMSLLPLSVLLCDMDCVHTLLGDVISDIKFPAATIKMAEQAASLAHTGLRCIKALVQHYCLHLLHYSTSLHLRCIIAEMRDCAHAYPTALNTVSAMRDDYRLLHKVTWKADLVAAFCLQNTSVGLPDTSLLVDFAALVCDSFGQAVQISYRVQHSSVLKLQAMLDAALFSCS